MNIEVIVLDEAEEFLDNLDSKARRKIIQDIEKTKMGLKGGWFKRCLEQKTYGNFGLYITGPITDYLRSGTKRQVRKPSSCAQMD
jgi:hypothetical protein